MSEGDKQPNWGALIVAVPVVAVAAWFVGPWAADALVESPREKAFHEVWNESSQEERDSLCDGLDVPEIRASWNEEDLDELESVCG